MKYQLIVVIVNCLFFTGCTSSIEYDGLPTGQLHVASDGQFSGESISGILTQIGKPDVIENEPPAKVFVYRSPVCAMAVFFYKKDINSEYEVERTEYRTVSGLVSNASCLHKIQSNH